MKVGVVLLLFFLKLASLLLKLCFEWELEVKLTCISRGIDIPVKGPQTSNGMRVFKKKKKIKDVNIACDSSESGF